MHEFSTFTNKYFHPIILELLHIANDLKLFLADHITEITHILPDKEIALLLHHLPLNQHLPDLQLDLEEPLKMRLINLHKSFIRIALLMRVPDLSVELVQRFDIFQEIEYLILFFASSVVFWALWRRITTIHEQNVVRLAAAVLGI